MILFDFTQPEAKLSSIQEAPKLLLRGGAGPQWDAAAFRFGPSGKYRIGTPDRKWHPQNGPRIHGESVEASLSKPGRYLARSFPGGRVGNAFAIEFALEPLKPDWSSLRLVIFSVNQRMVFNVLDFGPVIVDAGRDEQWTFNLGRRASFKKRVGEIPASTRFDRLNTFEIG